MKELRKKLRNDIGETIAETLIALLISSLALVMLASMITSTVNMVNSSKRKMDNYYEKNKLLEIIDKKDTEENGNTKTGSIKVINGSQEDVTGDIPVYFVKNDEFSNLPFAAYELHKTTSVTP